MLVDFNSSTTFIGNSFILEQLVSMFNSNRFPHAIIIEGEEGQGKKQLANFIACLVTCNEIPACGKCSICKRIFNNTHPDVVILSGSDGVKSFHIDKIRGIMSEIFIKPIEANKKVYILQDAQNMTHQAQNALLKILEEPPSDTLFILTCISATSMLSTIISRCVKFTVSPPSIDECLINLQSHFPSKSKDEILDVLSKSGQNIGRAIKLLENDYDTLDETLVSTLAKAFGASSEVEIITILSNFEKKKQSLKDILSSVLEIFSFVAIKRTGADDSLIVWAYKDVIVELSKKLSIKKTIYIIELLTQTIDKLDRNSNVNLTISWCAAQTILK